MRQKMDVSFQRWLRVIGAAGTGAQLTIRFNRLISSFCQEPTLIAADGNDRLWS